MTTLVFFSIIQVFLNMKIYNFWQPCLLACLEIAENKFVDPKIMGIDTKITSL